MRRRDIRTIILAVQRSQTDINMRLLIKLEKKLFVKMENYIKNLTLFTKISI